jgi:concanavalin A-like lectin/glucanase superfamily protein
MSLAFTSTNVVDVGAATSLDNIDTGSIMCWIKLTSTGANQTISRKGSGTTNRHLFNFLSGGPQFLIDRGTTDLTASATFANMSAIVAGEWTFMAASWDAAGVDGDQHLYAGNRTTLAVEAAAYGTQLVGSGAVGSDAADSMFLGNTSSGGNPLVGDISIYIIRNVTSTLGEIQSWQYNPRWLPNTQGLWIPGWNGTTNVPDLSVNHNTGTITGATVTADAPVLSAWNGAQPGKAPYLVVAGGGFNVAISNYLQEEN